MWPLRLEAFRVNYRQISQITKHIRWCNVGLLKDKCRMGRTFWSWSDVNRSTFDEDMHEKRFLHFRSQ